MKGIKGIKGILSQKKMRIMILLVAIIFQTGIVVLPYFFLREYLVHLTWMLEIFSILIVMYILKSDINPCYKLPWILILFIIPIFGGVLYVTYGRRHFSKKHIRRYEEISNRCKALIFTMETANKEINTKYSGLIPHSEYLLNYALAPAYQNTSSEYFSLGDLMFKRMLEELDKAERFIFMEYFIVEDGIMLNQILEVLIRKAGEGIDIRFMYDSLGSIAKAPVSFVRELKKCNVKCVEFNAFKSIKNSHYNNRDHRKICVIDGNVGFTGGINLADEYINEKAVYGHWKDTAIMLKGAAVYSLTIMFMSLWDVINDKDEDITAYRPYISCPEAVGFVLPYTDYPIDGENIGMNVYLNIINRARKYVHIMTPYLILDNDMSNSLIRAAKSGIDVKIITPGIPDKKAVNLLTKSYYSKLIEAGVKIYEYTPGFMHAKVFVSDDETAVVGTINLDYRSLIHHMENAVLLYRTTTVMDIKKDFDDTLISCENITLAVSRRKSMVKTVFLPILRLFAPLL